MDFDNPNTKNKCICIGVVFLICLVLFLMSWSAVEPTEYGLLYNSVTKKVSVESGKLKEFDDDSLRWREILRDDVEQFQVLSTNSKEHWVLKQT